MTKLLNYEQVEWYRVQSPVSGSNSGGWIKKINTGFQKHWCMYVMLTMPYGAKLPTKGALEKITQGHGGITWYSLLRRSDPESPSRSYIIKNEEEGGMREFLLRTYTPTRTLEIGWDYNHYMDQAHNYPFEEILSDLTEIMTRLVDSGHIFSWKEAGLNHYKRGKK